MSEQNLDTGNVPPVDDERKGLWPTASCRVRPDEMHLIDAAAYKSRKKRAQIIYEAVMAHVHEILKAA